MDGIGIWGVTSGKGDGIGQKIIDRFIRMGYDNIHVFGRDANQLQALAENLKNVKGWFSYDIENEEKPEEFEEYVAEKNINTMISAVGLGRGGILREISRRDLVEMTIANFVVPSLILKSTLAALQSKGGGKIIMFGSIVAINPREGTSGYTGSKAALKGLIESARYELRDFRTKVSIHAIYSTSFRNIGYETVLDAITYLMKIKQGIHVDMILNLQ